MSRTADGSATRWGPLFGRSRVGGDVGGPGRLGHPGHEHVLDRTETGKGTRVLDCGCGAGRFLHMAADRGASVAGIDASSQLIAIAAERVPEGEFRTGHRGAAVGGRLVRRGDGIQRLQFADDKVRALREARRVSRGSVAVVIPSRVPESGITSVFSRCFRSSPRRRSRR